MENDALCCGVWNESDVEERRDFERRGFVKWLWNEGGKSVHY
jgi:hypothetical protein